MKYLPNAWSNPTNESIIIGALLENELNSNVVRFTTHNQTCLQYIRFIISFYFLQKNLYTLCYAFYQPNANVFATSHITLILSNQKLVFTQLET